MAKRTIRKTDPDNTTAPEGRQPNGAAAPRARTGRSRKSAGATAGMAATDSTAVPADTAEASDSSRDAAVQAAGAPTDVPHDHIAVRAYHLYLQRGGRGGDQFHDWITAERELRERAVDHRLG